MGFNLLSALGGAVQGAAMGGNPLSIGAGAIAGGFAGNGATTVGGFSNGAQNLAQRRLPRRDRVAQRATDDVPAPVASAVATVRPDGFERSELLRETNTLRDDAMQQRKADNQIVKEFIRSIG